MAVYNILPSTNLKTEDIRDTLNAYGGSVSNDCLTFFTDTANIRIWAKYKPINYAKNFDLTDAERAIKNYGIGNIPWQTEFGACKAFIDRTSAELSAYYTYDRPTGGASSPYRLDDFRGYDGTATAPIYPSSKTNLTMGGNNTWVAVYVNLRGKSSHPNWLNISYLDNRDPYGTLILSADNCYLGVILKGDNGTFYAIEQVKVHTHTEGGDHETAITINDRNCYGTYKLMPFLIESSSLPNPDGNGYQAVKCLPLTMSISTVTIVKQAAQLVVTANYARADYGNGYRLYLTSIVIKNNGNISTSVSGLRCSFSGSNMTNVSNVSIWNVGSTSISIAPGETKTITSFTNNNFYTTTKTNVYGYWYLYVSYTGNEITKSLNISNTPPASGSF